MAEKRSKEGKRRKNQYASQYSMEHYERINASMPIGTKEKFKKIASEQGLSVSQMILQAVKEYAIRKGIKI